MDARKETGDTRGLGRFVSSEDALVQGAEPEGIVSAAALVALAATICRKALAAA